ncbi:hypothetical protein C1H46_037276 [Malus baccata]|uniref:Uncharacterized protein n=1 Tax=Malus baccata TaxID=106549 RepID=A0A540KT50_MALBA|nr:hypothetical protein C1H46_037276 [Malus baccata]
MVSSNNESGGEKEDPPLKQLAELGKTLKKKRDHALLLPAFEFECFTPDTASSTGPYKDSTADHLTKISRGILDQIRKTIGDGAQNVDAGPLLPERKRSTRCPVLGNTIWKKDETFALETAKGFCFPLSLSPSPVAPPLR